MNKLLLAFALIITGCTFEVVDAPDDCYDTYITKQECMSYYSDGRCAMFREYDELVTVCDDVYYTRY